MARKTSAQAEKDRQEREFNTWRLLVRNPSFRDDLKKLSILREVWRTTKSSQALKSYNSEQTTVCDNWGILRLPSFALAVSWTDSTALEGSSWTNPSSLEEAYLQFQKNCTPFCRLLMMRFVPSTEIEVTARHNAVGLTTLANNLLFMTPLRRCEQNPPKRDLIWSLKKWANLRQPFETHIGRFTTRSAFSRSLSV
jgi:hypothetical protein